MQNKYEKLEKLGEGTFGVVYRAKNVQTDEEVALKKIRKQQDEEGVPSSALREISLLKELSHINVIRLIEVINTIKKLTLVFEYVPKDLKRIIDETNNGKGLPIPKVKSYLYQLLKGIQHIHKHKILHRDLKPGNLLISAKGVVKIADFGLARGFGIPVTNYSNEVVTLWYRPPDVLLGNKDYAMNIDIWSIGCIFAEMVTGKALFTGLNDNDQIKKIFKIMGTPTEKTNSYFFKLPDWNPENFEKYEPQNLKDVVPGLDDDGYELLNGMLKMDPDQRIKTEDALDSPWFDDIQDVLTEIYK